MLSSLWSDLARMRVARLSGEQLKAVFEHKHEVVELPRLGTTLWPVTEYVKVRVAIHSGMFWSTEELESEWRFNLWSSGLALLLAYLVSIGSQRGTYTILRPASGGLLLGVLLPIAHGILFIPHTTLSTFTGALLATGALFTICLGSPTARVTSISAVLGAFLFFLHVGMPGSLYVLLNLFYLIVLCYSIEVILVLWQKYKKSFKHL